MTLRHLLLLASGAALLLALRAALRDPGDWGAAAAAAFVFAAILFERFRDRTPGLPPRGPGWQPTEERFLDPGTGQLVTVWYHAATGARRYVAAGPSR